MTESEIDECTLLGACMLAAQKFEFALYGIASHLPDEKKEKRFKELTPEKFLRGDVKELKATLGQLETAFGDKLRLSTEELKEFIRDRNVIAHNYWRLTKTHSKGTQPLENPKLFLETFLKNCEVWTALVRGLLWIMMQASAEIEGRTDELNFNDQQKNEMIAYVLHRSTRATGIA